MKRVKRKVTRLSLPVVLTRLRKLEHRVKQLEEKPPVTLRTIRNGDL
jgi:hypothetical protein